MNDHFTQSAQNVFAAGKLNRWSELRESIQVQDNHLFSELTLFVPLWQNQCLIKEAEGRPPETVFLRFTDIEHLLKETDNLIFLGKNEEVSYFSLHFSKTEHKDVLEKFGNLKDLRSVSTSLDNEELSVLAFAKALDYWHETHKFCGKCGFETQSLEAGHVRKCKNPDCGKSHFPRTDSAIIVLISNGAKCLLGRQASWPKGRYSCLAGFVEPGESLEDAVKREVWEESGVIINKVHYHSSQPWPFPASIMLGFFAEAKTEEIKIDNKELEDARWFSRSDIVEGLQNKTLGLSSEYSISFRLLEDWFNQGWDVPLKEVLKSILQ